MNKLLIVTSADDEHVSVAEDLLKHYGVYYLRFNTEDFPQKVSITFLQKATGEIQGEIAYLDRQVRLEEISHVWFRKPKQPVISNLIEDEGYRNLALQESESMLYWMYQALQKPIWMNHPDFNAQASSKILQMKVAADLGFNIPRTLITNNRDELKFFCEGIGGSLAIKTIGPHAYAGKGTGGDRVYGLYTKRISREVLNYLNFVEFCPTLLQEYIEKNFELRITVVKDKVFACEIHSQKLPETTEDWRHPEFVYHLEHSVHDLPEVIADRCRMMLKKFNLLFGAFDMIVTPAGDYIFVEMNANGQWLWVEDLTKLKITEEIVKVFAL